MVLCAEIWLQFLYTYIYTLVHDFNHNCGSVQENFSMILKALCLLSRPQRPACGKGLVKLLCWTLSQAPSLGTCFLLFTTRNIVVALNIPRMKWTKLLRYVICFATVYTLIFCLNLCQCVRIWRMSFHWKGYLRRTMYKLAYLLICFLSFSLIVCI